MSAGTEGRHEQEEQTGLYSGMCRKENSTKVHTGQAVSHFDGEDFSQARQGRSTQSIIEEEGQVGCSKAHEEVGPDGRLRLVKRAPDNPKSIFPVIKIDFIR